MRADQPGFIPRGERPSKRPVQLYRLLIPNLIFLFFASFILNPPFSSGQTPFLSSNVACSGVVLIERLGSEVPAFLPNSGDNSRIQHRLPLYTALP